jgi:hypothetical protein
MGISVAGLPARARPGRLLVFAAILGAHVLAVRFFPAVEPGRHGATREESPLIVLFLPAPAIPQSAGGAVSRPGGVRRTRPAQAAPSSAEHSPRPAARRVARSNSITVDWGKEAEAVAAHRLAAEEEEQRRAGALSQWKASVVPAPVTPRESQFAWDTARTRRFEPIPAGLLVHLGERCVLVISLMLMPACKLGSLASHGDLFEHMRDDPGPGN